MHILINLKVKERLKLAVKVLTVLLSLLLFASIIALNLPPEIWWGLSFIGAVSPVLWAINALWLLFRLIKPSWWLAFTVAALVAGLGVVSDTIAFSVDDDIAPSSVQVLSYNVSHFTRPKGYHFEKDSAVLQNPERIKEFVGWVVDHPADIKCFQEYYNFSGNPIFDVHEKLRQQGWQYSYLSVDTLRINRSHFGVAIYSKYPITDSGLLFVGRTGFNRGIWADVSMGSDTVRVINVHLQSIQLQRTLHKNQERGKKESIKNTYWAFRESQKEIIQQLRIVQDFIRQSPHPVLLAGDFNSTPYSHVYQILDDELENAFTEKGSGFGFTFNHPTISFLRIDHQFVTSGLKVSEFKTRQDVPFSAHYPIEGWYQLLQAVPK